MSRTRAQRIARILICAAVAAAVLVVLYAVVMFVFVAVGVWGGA